MRKIHVSQPSLGQTEIEYTADAVKEGAISGYFGKYLERFENEFSRFCGCQYGISVTNGTTALHLALASLGIGKDDEILISTYTNMATFFAAHYQGAIPIPIDILEDTWNLDPSRLESKITPRTKAIIVVHIFGHPVEMDPVLEIAKKYNLFLIEDCAQAHGAEYKGKRVGSFGDVGCFSFYANKIITTGEGGMVVTNHPDIVQKAKSLKSLAFGEPEKFMHTAIGFNYRMTNVQAAMGCAQLEKIDWLIERKRYIAHRYTQLLKGFTYIKLPTEKPYSKNVYWMYHIVLDEKYPRSRDSVMSSLAKSGIETRPGFIPYNMQRIFIEKGYTKENDCPVANYIGQRSFYLPSGPELTDDDLVYVSSKLCDILES
jgi:perosamine synthetase